MNEYVRAYRRGVDGLMCSCGGGLYVFDAWNAGLNSVRVVVRCNSCDYVSFNLVVDRGEVGVDEQPPHSQLLVED